MRMKLQVSPVRYSILIDLYIKLEYKKDKKKWRKCKK